MPRKPIKFELDFMIKDIFPRFTVKQFDDVSFNIKPLNQGLDYDTSNMIGKIFVGVNNDMFMQTTDITVSSDNINVLLDKNMLQKNGRAYAEIELTDEAGTITSSSFIFDIDPKIGEGGMIPGEYEGFVEKYERLISEFKAQINSSIDNSNNLIDKTIKNCNTSVDNKLNTVDSLVNTKITNINNTLNKKVSEVDSKLDTVDGLITAKVSDFERRFSALTSSQQQNSEVIDAREGEVSLKARLDKDIENPKKLYTSIEGTEISVDSLEGYLKDIEILGNTVQDQNNLADIRSVGDKLENQELYEIPVLIRGKNLFDGKWIDKTVLNLNQTSTLFGEPQVSTDYSTTENFIPVRPNTTYYINSHAGQIWVVYYDRNKTPISHSQVWTTLSTGDDIFYIRFYDLTSRINNNPPYTISIAKKEEYEPYQEHKLTILSPKQLKSYNDTKDRIVCKNGVWVHEENVTYDAEGNGTILSKSIDTPLPHDQQISIRTFANKTNISFGCEIEPTLKASVPKSIGATVNSHTEQIDNLGKELDRVKKLEESVASEVVSESDFITVENTSNGYFEDVKLEGRTLVNLFNVSECTNYNNYILESNETLDISKLKPDTIYTGILFDNTNKILSTSIITKNGAVSLFRNMYNKIFTFKTPQDLSSIKEQILKLYSYADSETKPLVDTDVNKINFILLEGDHTQNPPEYFEGLKSVGDGVDEISVLSCNNTNEFRYYTDLSNWQLGSNDCSLVKENDILLFKGSGKGAHYARYLSIDVFNKNKITVGFDFKALVSGSSSFMYYHFLNSNGGWIGDNIGMFATTNVNASEFTHFSKTITVPTSAKYIVIDLAIYGASASGFYIKNLTFTEGEKELPYITNKQDKKRILYYNTETDTWEKPVLRQFDSIEKHSDNKYYYHVRSEEVPYTEGDETKVDHITDMTTTVKKASTEKVYECTNLDLITYSDETNFMVKSGVLNPKVTLKVKKGIGNVVTMLQNKVAMLEDIVNKLIQK